MNEDENKGDTTSLKENYTPSVEIKDCNVLIDGKSFVNLPEKSKEEKYKKVIELSTNSDYTTGNLLDYGYFSNLYNLIKIDLIKQIELENLDLKQQINFINRLREDC